MYLLLKKSFNEDLFDYMVSRMEDEPKLLLGY